MVLSKFLETDLFSVISSMHWWQIPLFIVIAAWALYLYSTPSARVAEHMARIREWWRSRRS
jgi:hypothetical protein